MCGCRQVALWNGSAHWIFCPIHQEEKPMKGLIAKMKRQRAAIDGVLGEGK